MRLQELERRVILGDSLDLEKRVSCILDESENILGNNFSKAHKCLEAARYHLEKKVIPYQLEEEKILQKQVKECEDANEDIAAKITDFLKKHDDLWKRTRHLHMKISEKVLYLSKEEQNFIYQLDTYLRECEDIEARLPDYKYVVERLKREESNYRIPSRITKDAKRVKKQLAINHK
eukprot:UC4_evm1s487